MNHTVMFYCQFEIESGPSWPCLQQCGPHFSRCSGLPSSQRNGLLSSAYVILRLHETPFCSTFLPQTRTMGLRTTWSDLSQQWPQPSVSVSVFVTFLIVVTKFHTRSKKCLFWIRVCGDIVKSIMWGEECPVAHHIVPTVRKQVSACAQPFLSLSFYPTPSCDIHTQGEPSFLKSLRNHPYRYFQIDNIHLWYCWGWGSYCYHIVTLWF